MINPSKKIKFINEWYTNVSQKTKDNYMSVLNKVCEMEDYYKKDLSEFSELQLNAVVESLSNTYSNYTRCVKLINNYNEWCGSNRRVSLSYENADNDTVLTNRFVFDFADLYAILEEAFVLNEWCADAFYALIIMLSWVGLTKPEILELKKYAIDTESRSIQTADRMFENVNSVIINHCFFCSTIQRYETINQTLCDNDYVFRTKNNCAVDKDAPLNNNIINLSYKRLNERTDGKYTYNSIRKSGLFYYLFTKEKTGEFDINKGHTYYDKVLSEYFGKEYRYSNGTIQDYKSWKEAFALFATK